MKCYLCGSVHSLTNDHIPPKGFFPQPRPSNLITVPCCAECNFSYSKDDEAVRAWFSTLWGRTPAGDWIFEKKVLKGVIIRSPQFRDAMLDSIKPRKLITENGIVDVSSFDVPWNRVERFVIRCVKGLLTFHYPNYDYSADIFEVRGIPQTTENLADLEELRDYLEYDERGEGVIQYRRGLTDTKQSGVWMLTFYGAILFVVFHGKTNLKIADYQG